MLKKALTAFLAATVLVVLSLLARPGIPVAADEPQSEYWAVIVGVAEYQAYWIQDLVGFDANARDLSQLLSPAWGEDHVRLLLNSEATKANVLEAVNWLVSREDNDDAVLFYFAGHGIPEYIAPHDADNLDTFISAA
ncbi:MAG: caspase family protein, partial [Dehalococcoidales bacterium]